MLIYVNERFLSISSNRFSYVSQLVQFLIVSVYSFLQTFRGNNVVKCKKNKNQLKQFPLWPHLF